MEGSVYGVLLLAMILTFSQFANTQDRADVSKASQGGAASRELGTAGKTALSAITDVQVTPGKNSTTVLITADQPVTPQKFKLDGPARLVLDFPNSQNDIQSSSIPIRDASVKQLRVRQFQTTPSPIVRMVFDLESGGGDHEISVDKNQTRIVFRHKEQTNTTVAEATGVKPTTGAAGTTGTRPMPGAAVVPPIREEKTAEVRPMSGTVVQLPSREGRNAMTPIAQVSSETSAGGALPLTVPKELIPTLPDQAPSTTEKTAEAKPVPALIAALTSEVIPELKETPRAQFSGPPLTLDLVNVPLVDFFRLLADEGGINIVLDPSVNGAITIKVEKMPWDQIFEAALRNNGLDKQIEGSMVRVARKSTLQAEAKQMEELKTATMLAVDLDTRVKRLNYAKAFDLKKIIDGQKTKRGTIIVDERTNSLILTDVPYAVDNQIKLIESLDVPQPQVEIEARIVSATRNFARDIGVQFGFVQGNLERVTVGGPNTFGTIGGTRPSATPNTAFAASSPSNGRGATGSSASSPASVSTGTGGSNSGNYNVNLPAKSPFGGIGVSVGNILDTFLLDAAITAGESKGWAKLLSQPKVVAQNNDEALITNGIRFPVTVNANNTITVQFFDAALTLKATPQITYEGDIMLKLKLENNTADFGYTSVGGVPTIRTAETTTVVRVSDGGTTMLGGIIIENDGSSEEKVPGLGSLPLLGNLFKRTSTTRDSSDLMFFITPRIVK